MLEIQLGGKNKNCAGVTRRDAIKIGALTAGGLTLGDALRLRAAKTQAGQPGPPARGPSNNKAVICFWLDGGPTHIDTFDPKPRAPKEYRGPFQAIETAVPGTQICELFPQMARAMKNINLIRSMHHDNGDHFAAAHWMWTGYHGSNAVRQEPMYPSVGAVTAKVRGPNRPGAPAFVAVPYAATVGLRPGYMSGAFLGVAYNPFDAGSDPNSSNFQVRNLGLPGGINVQRVSDRKNLLAGLDRVRREIDCSGLMDGMDQFNEEAISLIVGDTVRKAFDIHKEDPRLRDRYGRTSVGQSALLARRLVEGGVTFVTIHAGGWDNHASIEPAMKNHARYLDPAVATLVDDLDQRGLTDEVMILIMGEFGRTPKMNSGVYPIPGRDHWGNVMSVVLCGGGLQNGVVVGASDEKGTRPIKHPVKPAHVLHTVYRQLGIDPYITHVNHAGRPIPVLSEGEPIADLV